MPQPDQSSSLCAQECKNYVNAGRACKMYTRSNNNNNGNNSSNSNQWQQQSITCTIALTGNIF